MTTSTPALPFLAIVPAYHGPGLPTCPDGSGDLWWDDASYARYQAFDPEYREAYIAEAVSPGFCDGRDDERGPSCPCHVSDLPF